jgi:hypothetical protein
VSTGQLGRQTSTSSSEEDRAKGLRLRLQPLLTSLVGPAGRERARAAWRWLDSQFDRWRGPARTVEPYVPGEMKLGWSLTRPAIMGFVATTAIFLGATQPNSPFTSKLPDSWYFGIPAPALVQGYNPAPGQWLFLGVVAVYGGMVLLIRAWYDIFKLTSEHPGFPVIRLAPVFATWVLPLLVVAPLFSKDVYAYAAQGEMMSHGINPYLYGTGVLGATPFSHLVDRLWINSSSPYGPFFLVVDGWIVTVAHHDLLLSIVGLRLLALVGVILFAVAVPSIARSFGRDPATAFVLVALNPLVLLNLVGGAHNDALMVGLLAAGYAFSRRHRPVVGIVLCGLAAAVKVPALIGAVYIGWEWLGPGRSIRERVRPVATALLIAVGTMVCISEVANLGWGWIGGLTEPDTVRSWLDPATGIALVLGHLVAVLGFGHHVHVILTVVRGTAACIAGLIGLWLLVNSERVGSLQALGWSLFAVVVLGPVVQLWYLSWSFVFLAPVAVGLTRKVVIGVSAVACFLGLTGGHVFINEIKSANSVLVAFACAALVAIGAFLLRPKNPRARPTPRELVSSS